MSNKESAITTKVMDTIERRHVTPRSRIRVFGEYAAWASLLISSVLLIIAGANIVFAWLSGTPSLRYLHFGGAGWQAFLDGAPVLWLLLAITGVIVSAIALKHYDISYKLPFPALLAAVAIGGLLIGLGFARAGFVSPGYRPLPPHVFRAMHRAGQLPPPMGIHHINRHGVVGTVIEIRESDDYLIESTGRKIIVVTSNGTRYLTSKPMEGDDIRAIGQFTDEDKGAFRALGIEVIR